MTGGHELMRVDLTTTLAESAVVRLAEERAEPGWLRESRIAAYRAFVDAPAPDPKRTPIDRVDLANFIPYRAADGAGAGRLPERVRELIAAAGADGALLVQVDSTVAYRRVPPHLAAAGVILTSLDEAVREHEALVREHLFSLVPHGTDKLTALHGALQTGGLFLYVPKDVRVEVPVQFTVYSETEGLGLFPHVLVVADRGAEVTVVERYVSGSERHLVSQVVEVIAKENAKVTFASLQTWGDGAQCFHTRRARLYRDATVNWVLGELGGSVGRSQTLTRLEGHGSQSTALMVIFGDQDQHLDAGLVMNHIGHYTSSDMLTKSVLKDRARCVYRAMTDIEDGALNTSGFQVENALILNKGARIDAIPELEIEETEVQAGHAATVGQVDEEQLFYLMSRGLPRSEGIRLIVEGFLDPLLSRIPLEDVRGELQKLIDRKMNR